MATGGTRKLLCADQDLGARLASRPDPLGVRWAVGWVPIVGSLLTIAVVVPLVWTHKHQGVHEMVARTLVVREGV